ncbi:hypothetical protein O181_047533 [Austropuccinia psidii MF-1]|uniref:Protein kinase domain-containing protein n=1 Tax=Austropuccinia psidii MF-1 TaxID=1389203 RepID=A0A9Q3HJL5_9BASI|nr:hypothetical protein [Austropuccinia psidii MF-1]
MSTPSSSVHSTSVISPSSSTLLPNVGTRDYTILKEVGDGSFGTVWLADWHSPLNLPPGTQPPGPSSRPEYKGKQLVAIKKMKKPFEGGWDECMKLKELKSLRTIPMHPFTIPLYDTFLHPTTRELYFVFECMEGNLYQLTKSRKGRPLAGGLIACIFEQTLLGLHHVHSCGFFHRDMKPENLLITTTGLTDYPHGSPFALPTAPPERDVAVIVKIADFGLARETLSRPPYTEYVSTRWYRAPEVLLRARDYSNPVDMWALGAIMVETVTLKPLFPGNSEMDQVHRICEIMGDPKHNYGLDDKGRLRGGGQWIDGVELAKAVGFTFPDKVPIDFVQMFDVTSTPIQLVDCLHELLRYNPIARLTTYQCLSHPYFLEIATKLIPASHSSLTMLNPSLTHDLPPHYRHNHNNLLSYPSSPQHLNPTNHHHHHHHPPNHPNQQHYLPVDLPSISPQIVPHSHNQGLFPNARPTHVITPSNNNPTTVADSVMSDPDIRATLGPESSSGHLINQTLPSTFITHPENDLNHNRPSNSFENYSTSYDYSSSMISQDPSYLSLSPGLLNSNNHSYHSSEPGHHSSSRNLTAITQHKLRGRSLASVFSSSQSIKHPPSDQLINTSSSTTTLIDSKKAKKEAEKAAKEEAKLEAQAKREAARRSAQERSRAVLQKQRLAQGSDLLIHANPEFAAPVGTPRKSVDKGKGRAALPPPMPQIVEDCSRPRLNSRPNQSSRRIEPSHQSHSDRSIYYTQDQYHLTNRKEERRYSVNSSNTMDSDPGPRSSQPHLDINRSSSIGSGYSRLSVASSPNLASLYRASTPASTASSLDHQLVANMAGLTANEHDPSNHHHLNPPHPHHHHLNHHHLNPPNNPPTNPNPNHNHNNHHNWQSTQSNGNRVIDETAMRRSRSPSDPRFSPYAIPNLRPSLPSIANFDFTNHGPPPFPSPNLTVHDPHLSISSGTPSILSNKSFTLGPHSPFSPSTPYYPSQSSKSTSAGVHRRGSHHSLFDLPSPLRSSSDTHYSHLSHLQQQSSQAHHQIKLQQHQQSNTTPSDDNKLEGLTPQLGLNDKNSDEVANRIDRDETMDI